jgi:hypothetical protein
MIVMLATNIDSDHRRTAMLETKTKILVCSAGSNSFKFSFSPRAACPKPF